MLIVEDLVYQYGTQRVLSELSFTLEAGRVAVLVGRNGAGKSTLLRCLAGWTMPEKGSITLNDHPISKEERQVRQDVILVPDTPDFYDSLTAQDHLQFIAQVHHLKDWQAQSEELLAQFQLEDHKNALPFTYSRGMRYKLALCMALLVRPRLLLLDEPFGPLDATASKYLWSELQDYRSEGHSILLSSHTLPDGEKPDEIFLLQNQELTSVDPNHMTDLAELLSYA